MHRFIKPVIGEGHVARHRIQTAAIVVIAALAMLSGIGQRVLDSHSNLGDADHLAALSLIMSGVPRDALPVTFLDVDDRTRLDWGATGVTPHAALAALIQQAADNGAWGILVDFDLTPIQEGASADPKLAELLRGYPATAPQLMLARKIHFLRGGGNAGERTVQAASAPPTPYDGDIAGKPNIGWVTTLNDIAKDRSVRRIRLWQTICEGAAGIAYPSAALVVAAYPADGPSHAAELVSFLQSRVAAECGHSPVMAMAWPPVQNASAQLPFVFADGGAAPAQFRIVQKGGDTVALRRISAGQLVKVANGIAAAAGDIDRDPFAGRVVIIGASYADSGDIYETPFGTMPGALVLANSIVQAKTITELAPASALTKNLLAMLLFLLLAWVARTFIGAAAVVILGAATLTALFLISRNFGFSSGIDVIAVAVPGFAFFKLIDSLVFIAMSVPKQGWRAVLKP